MVLNYKLMVVISKLSDLEPKYAARRIVLDGQRFLGNWRGQTVNQDRQNDCLFMHALAGWVKENRFEYRDIYKRFNSDLNKSGVKVSYDSCVAPFLKEAMLGAMILTLSKISKSYTNSTFTGCDEASVKNYSALAYVLLNEFNLGTVSEIDPMARCSYLRAFSRLVTSIDDGHKTDPSLALIQWHPSYSNDVLLQQLNNEIGAIETVVVASPSEEGRLAL